MEIQSPQIVETEKRFGLSANALKLIAITAMLIDHTAAVFMNLADPQTVLMRGIGRITAPIMFYFLAEGYHKTRNVNKYTSRLALFAAISYVPFIYCMEGSFPNSHNYMRLNVIFTLFLALLALRARNEIKNPVVQWLIICTLLFVSLTADWSYIAIIMVLMFDYFYGDYKKQAFGYCMLSLFYIAPQFLTVFQSIVYSHTVNWVYVRMLMLYIGMFIPVLLLKFYNGEKGKGGKAFSYLFYIFYPLHLLVLGWVKHGVVW